MVDTLFLMKFLRFCVVGGSGVFVDFGVTWLVKERLRWNKFVANSMGFVIAATSNYILNRVWTFQSQNESIGSEYLSFIGIALVGLAINNSIIYLLNERLKMNFYLAKLFAIGITTIWNFLMNYFFNFQ